MENLSLEISESLRMSTISRIRLRPSQEVNKGEENKLTGLKTLCRSVGFIQVTLTKKVTVVTDGVVIVLPVRGN